MNIRRAELVDLNACLALDRSYDTDYVWQMEERQRGDELAITFRTVRLPRTMRVQVQGAEEGVLADWQQGGCFFVGEQGGAVIGFVDAAVPHGSDLAWLRNLVVDKRARRRGVGGALLSVAVEWAEAQQARGLAVAVQTKNYPAISFCQRFGLTFCGFNDQHFANRDIAVYFMRPLR